MKRFQFLLAVFGFGAVAKAQQWKVCKPDAKYAHLCSGENMPALNNQCPTCGTMAELYKRPMQEDYRVPRNCKPIGEFLTACDPPKMIPYGDGSIITRCKVCNAAFWQDAV